MQPSIAAAAQSQGRVRVTVVNKRLERGKVLYIMGWAEVKVKQKTKRE